MDRGREARRVDECLNKGSSSGNACLYMNMHADWLGTRTNGEGEVLECVVGREMKRGGGRREGGRVERGWTTYINDP